MKTISVSLALAASMLGAWAEPAAGEGPPPPPPGEKRPPPPERERRGGRPPEGLWKRADTNNDGYVSREEFAALKRIAKLPEDKRGPIFDRLDKDGDGKLSKDELEKRPGSQPPRGFPSLAELDVDRSGGVSFVEFQGAEFVKKLPAERQREVFDRLDRDKDGQITPKDRPSRRESEGPRPEGRGNPERPSTPEGRVNGILRQILRTLDANADSAVTFEEYQKGPFAENWSEDEAEKRFQALDRDGDKKLTANDLIPVPEAAKPEPAEPKPDKPAEKVD